MIRINLLGSSKPKKGKRPAMSMPTLTMEGPSVLVIGLALIALSLAGSYYWYWRVTRQHEDIQTQLQAADRRIKELSVVKTKYEEKDKQAKQLKKRFDVIDQLRSNQSGPVALLAMLGDTVSKTDAVWLNTMKDAGSTVEIEGMALSNVAVANLMTNLRKSGHFKNVELKETLQEDTKVMQTFTFTLVCEKTSEKKA